ncbi:MAG: hypothetical protein HQK56_10990 [Deltaproteobacteria bacterium]|nr:hypothetical protein [Deltaproteobacteria bacterium]
MPIKSADQSIVLTAIARLDNREELCRELGLDQAVWSLTPDSTLVFEAHRRWGENSPSHLFGDWSYAAWDPKERCLFLARDQLGNTSLFYAFRPPLVAFASHHSALTVLNEIPTELDEEWLFSSFTFVSLPNDRTPWRGIRTVLSGHCVSFAGCGEKSRCYWDLRSVPVRRLPRDEDYLEGFLEHFRSAVDSRLRSVGPIGSTLSAGLDSGTVTALAAEKLAEYNDTLDTFTSVPLFPSASRHRLSDEWPLARIVVDRYPNIIPSLIRAENASPVAALRRVLEWIGQPVYAAANMFWIDALFSEARLRGIKVLLTGQLGNGGVSWDGGVNRMLCLFLNGNFTSGFTELKRWSGYRGVSLARAIAVSLIRPIMNIGRQFWLSRLNQMTPPPLLNADFARRHMHLFEENKIFVINPSRARYLSLFRNGVYTGLLWHCFGTVNGMEVRDPTADVRLLEFCLGVPEAQDVHNGGDRMLLRRATIGILPDAVRLNRVRGGQAADIALRLVRAQAEVEDTLTVMSTTPSVTNYIDIHRLRHLWAEIRSNPQSAHTGSACSRLMRFLSAGFFLISSQWLSGNQSWVEGGKRQRSVDLYL